MDDPSKGPKFAGEQRFETNVLPPGPAHPSWRSSGRGGAGRLHTCLESGVRRFRLAVDMVREMLIPANWRLLLPKMLESILLGGCGIKQKPC